MGPACAFVVAAPLPPMDRTAARADRACLRGLPVARAPSRRQCQRRNGRKSAVPQSTLQLRARVLRATDSPRSDGQRGADRSLLRAAALTIVTSGVGSLAPLALRPPARAEQHARAGQERHVDQAMPQAPEHQSEKQPPHHEPPPSAGEATKPKPPTSGGDPNAKRRGLRLSVPFRGRNRSSQPQPHSQPPSSSPSRAIVPKSSDNALFNAQPRSAPRTSSSFVAKAAQAVGPSVVRIDTERVVPGGSLESLLDDPTYRMFFEDDFEQQKPRERLERGQGSGLIVSSDGLLLTNAHVVAEAQKVTVTLTSGRQYVADVMGTDDLHDLAILKIKSAGEALPAAPLGTSHDLHVGDWIIALGNPVGLDNTVTLGIVSSLNRPSVEVGIPGKKIRFIQTDAAINIGNSGGPLVNEFGEVVGISTAIRANANGIGFAIPIDLAKNIKDALARGEGVQHPFIGISMTTLTPERAKEYNDDPNAAAMLPACAGVLIEHVGPKTPAAMSGLRRFDVIRSVDGQPTAQAGDVEAIVDASKVGQELAFKVQRGSSGAEVTMRVKTGDLTAFRPARSTQQQQQQQQPKQALPSPDAPNRMPQMPQKERPRLRMRSPGSLRHP